jgi:SAM-dependent methyltransferase
MDDPIVLQRMRSDWNERAAEDAYYYVAFGRREQDDEEFFSTAGDIVKGLIADLGRLRARDAALEIGCGPGRLMKPLSRYFGEIHGIDISDEMVRLAHERLRDVPNAHAHHTSGADLFRFADGSFDFVYSYAVFQHIPSREVVFNYLREAHRVLKPGGVLRCQLNGLPAHARQYDTWSGVRIAPDEILEFTRDGKFQLLAVEQIWTQYMWITCRKRPGDWTPERIAGQPAVRNISNAFTGEAVVPSSGPAAALSIYVRRLSTDVDLNRLAAEADARPCRLTYIGEPGADGATQVNAVLPEGIRTGLVPVQMKWLGEPVCPPAWMRVMPPGPAVPRIASITDGINLLSGTRIVTRSVKVTMFDVTHPEDFRATVDGEPGAEIDAFCADPIAQRFEFNFRIPERVPPGPHHVTIAIGKREFPAAPILVAE